MAFFGGNCVSSGNCSGGDCGCCSGCGVSVNSNREIVVVVVVVVVL